MDGEPAISETSVTASEPPYIHILPYELLAEVLLLRVTPPTDTYTSAGVATSVNSVLALSQVCAHWRRVAHGTPRLWLLESFPIFTRSLPERKPRVAFTATEMFLERSAPLPVSIVYSPTLLAGKIRPIPPMMDLICRVAPRWKSFMWESQMTAPEPDIFMRVPSGRLGNLEKVELRLGNLEVWETPAAFSSAPRLRDVTISMLPVTSAIIPMPWAQITRLSLKYLSPQVCLDIIVCCPNVVSVTLNTRQWRQPDTPLITERVCLSKLQDLEIRMSIWTTGENLAPFLQRLQLPALQSLFLWAMIDPVADPFMSPNTRDFISFLNQSPNLSSLSIDSFFSAEEMSDILQYIPSLTTLDFSGGVIKDHFLAALQYSETDSVPLVPKLERLHLEDSGDYTESSVLDMIRSRWWSDDELLAMPPTAVARFKSMELWVRPGNELPPYQKTSKFYEAVNLYREQGLELLGEGFD
jgi:hypothetical protein